jgi:hypothetical protein
LDILQTGKDPCKRKTGERTQRSAMLVGMAQAVRDMKEAIRQGEQLRK